MRVPTVGQDLVERRIVREGKLLAEAMLANLAEPSGLTIGQIYKSAGERLFATFRGLVLRY